MSNQTGTVKVGRWTYTAERREDGIVNKQNKDGSWTLLGDKEGANFVPDAEVVAEAAPAVEEYTDLSPLDKAMLAQIGNTLARGNEGRSFDFFDDGIVAGSGIWFAHAADQTMNPPAARRAFKSLANKGYIEINGGVDHDAKDRWMVLTQKGATAALAFRGQSTELPELKAGHAVGGGNQNKRPGKSTWKLGTNCPQGHKLTKDSLYTMPSGRNQCRECRGTMPSRVAKSSE